MIESPDGGSSRQYLRVVHLVFLETELHSLDSQWHFGAKLNPLDMRGNLTIWGDLLSPNLAGFDRVKQANS